MHIFWTHIFTPRDVYLLIKVIDPHRELQGGLEEMMAVQVRTQQVLSKQASRSFTSGPQPKNSTAYVREGRLALSRKGKTRNGRYRKGNVKHLPHADQFIKILVLVLKSGEVKVLVRAATIWVGFKRCSDPQCKNPTKEGTNRELQSAKERGKSFSHKITDS